MTNLSLAFDKKTVGIPLLDWSSQRVISIALGRVLEDKGYKVQYQQMSESTLWGALARGNVHFQIEIWQGSANKEFMQMIEKSRIVDLGKHSAATREEWWYPDYVQALCPGLPDWRALNQCSHLFAEKGESIGSYLTGPWPFRDADLIRSLKLNFKIVNFEDVGDIWQKLELAEKNNKAILLLNWTPNWTDGRLKGKFIEFPPYEPECETDAKWGINKESTFDCGNITDGWIKKAGWSKFEAELPCVYQFIRNVDLSNSMIAEAAAIVNYDKKIESEAADIWLEKYQGSVDRWVAASCLAKAY